MKRTILGVIICILLIGCAVSLAEADDISGKFGIGLGSPYISLKYGFSSKLSGEIRGAFGSGVLVYGIRGYYNFNPQSRGVIFIGGEGDLVSFNTEGISGNGNVVMLFLGYEFFTSDKLSLSIDIGPASITVSSGETSISGIEWVFNIGVNFYF